MTTDSRAETSEPDYGPSLPELLWPRLRALGRARRIALAVGFGIAVLAVAALAIRGQAATKTYRQDAGEARRRGLAPIPFHFDHSSKMKVTKPPGAYLRAERTVSGTLAARFTVSELSLPIGRRSGLLSGSLPILATQYERRTAPKFEGFRLQFEGRARLNDVEGYQFAFSARLPEEGGARQLFGRYVMLPEPFDLGEPDKPYPPGRFPSRGLLIEMLATTLDRVPSATRVGDEGILQRPYRSFRFGS
jgi:hypothetical protein